MESKKAGMLSIYCLVITLAGLCKAQSNFAPLRPPAIPLAVRSPYLSTWQQSGSDGGDGGYLPGQWPTFWHGAITGWTGLIRVDNVTYTWMGKPDINTANAVQTAMTYTSTRSTFVLEVGGAINMTAEFLSPVTPNDLMRSSLPYSYLNIIVESIDGKQHDVQLYTDISAEWVSGNRDSIAEWKYGSTSSAVESATRVTEVAGGAQQSSLRPDLHVRATSAPIGARPDESSASIDSSTGTIARAASVNSVAYHQIFRQQQLEFAEFNEQAEWGNWYYSTSDTDALSFQSGADDTVRKNFVASGALPNTQDPKFRAISDAFPVFAYATDLGQVGTDARTTLYQLSLHQKNCVQFQDKTASVSKIPCLWNDYFTSELAAVTFFYNDFDTAAALATTFDNKVAADSIAAGGQDYASMTSLAVRQAFASVEFVNSPAEPYVFMKEISSDGNVNTVDVIYPFHPIALYANPSILKWLLDPLFINQEAGNWPKQYSIHDIGSAYPNATGHSDGNAEDMPLEECGNMLIMTLAYAQRAQDTAYLQKHYSILKQWTGFLVQEALYPQNQISTDDFAGPAVNQTNLALKGIIGIEAMAQIANLTGNVADSDNFTTIAHDYISKWQGLAIDQSTNPPHTTFNYNNASSYSLLYNLFADRELGLGLVPQAVYDMQSTFYPTKLNTYGVPLDTRHTYTKNDWEIFCAAIASSSTRNVFISNIAKWLNQTPTNMPFGDLYDTVSGNYPSDGPTFVARPVVGGMFALLALNSAP